MLQVPFILAVCALVTGCATGASRDLPKCDGSAKRPLNAGLWIPTDPELARQMQTVTSGRVLFRQEPAEILDQSEPNVVRSYAPEHRAAFPVAVPAQAGELSPTSSSTTC